MNDTLAAHKALRQRAVMLKKEKQALKGKPGSEARIAAIDTERREINTALRKVGRIIESANKEVQK